MENESKDVSGQEDKQEAAPVLESSRDAFMSRFEETHEAAEVESKEEPVSASNDTPAASAVKDDSVQTPKAEDDKKSSVPEGYVRKEALDEERSRRKRLSQKLKQLEDAVKTLESKATQPAAPQSEDTAEEDETPKEKELRLKLQSYEAAKAESERSKQLEAQKEQASRVKKQISDVDKSLRDEGFPGFRLGASLVDERLREMLDAEEIDEEDYRNPDMWKRVYKDSVYTVVAEEFGLATKKAINEKKIAAKEQAAKVSSMAGAKDEAKKPANDEDEEYDPEKDRKEYFASRRQRPTSRF